MFAVAFDTETTGLTFHDVPFCATAAWRTDDGELVSRYWDLDDESERIDFAERLCGADIWIGHNLKFDIQKLIHAGVLEHEDTAGRELHDTEGLARMLWPHDPAGLKPLARRVLGEETDEEEVLKAYRRMHGLKKDDGYQWIEREVLEPYALKDAEFTYRLWELLLPKLDDAGMGELYRHAMREMLTLLRMESRGVGIDVKYLTETAEEYAVRIGELLAEIREIAGNDELNPASPKQLLEAFAQRGVSLEGTAVEDLRNLKDPLAEAVLAYRKAQKIYKTYLVGILKEQRDGIVHPWIRLFGPSTGRYASGTAEG